MSKYSTSAIILTILWCALMISWIVLSSINESTCSKIQFASLSDMMNDFKNFKFSSPSTRKTAETIAREKLNQSTDEYAKTLKVDTLSDNALYAIIISTIALTNPTFIDVLDNYRYVETILDYSPIDFKFKVMRDVAIEILSNKHIPDLDKSIDDKQLYDMLVNGTKTYTS